MTKIDGLVDSVRQGLADVPDVAAHRASEAPSVQQIYVVNGHEQALNPDTTLVVGDRGSGKSFWSAALSDPDARQVISQQLPRLRLNSFQVAVGFGGERGDTRYPSMQVLADLLKKDLEAEQIWRTVVLQHLLGEIEEQLPGTDWAERVQFVAANPEREEQWLSEINSRLQSQRRGFLIVFDALDRLGRDWPTIRALTQGLLKVCLDMRSFSALHIKLFMRPDMWADKTIWTFPDASKLQHNRVVLEWLKVDLYGLLWHWLANRPTPAGERFRQDIQQLLNLSFKPATTTHTDFYPLPLPLSNDEERQEQLLNHVSTPYMGSNRRRGKTYSWLPNHLSDSNGHVSPRSFLLAVKEAMQVTLEKGYPQALHYEGIKAGVTKASDIRLQELKEDYPWVGEVLQPLRGLVVPAETGELFKRWKTAKVVAQLKPRAEQMEDGRQFLPPHALEGAQSPQQQLQALLQTLVEIGVVHIMSDGRVNIPDLFRVGAGIGRRGGVRAVR